jgi:hypothetical protein
MTSMELTEWMAFFKMESEKPKTQKTSTASVLKAMFAHKVIRKGT